MASLPQKVKREHKIKVTFNPYNSINRNEAEKTIQLQTQTTFLEKEG